MPALLTARPRSAGSTQTFSILTGRGRPGPHKHFAESEDADFVLQLVDQLLGDFSWGAFEELGLLGLLRNIQALDLLAIVADGGGDFIPGDLAQRLVLRLLDADQSRISQLVNAGLDGEDRRKRHVHKLEVAGFEFP